jgi:hypothetical protein
MTHLGPGLCPHDNLWQAFAFDENGEHVDLGTYGFMTDAVAAINYHEAYHGRELINVPTPPPSSPHRYSGVHPCPGGWSATILLPGAWPERLEGVFGFASDALAARNYFIAHWEADHDNKFNPIPEGENHHD